MNKLNGFEIRDYSFPIRPSWDKSNENLLDLSFIVEDSKGIWDRKFNVTINFKGEIVQCGSLIGTLNNIDYYITMGENLKIIKSFCQNKGEELFAKVENVVNENDKFFADLYDDVKIQIEKLKEEYNYDDLYASYNHLVDTVKAFKKQLRRLKREDKIEELTKQIEGIKKVIEEVKNKLHEYEEKEKEINEKAKIKRKEIKEKKYNILKEIEKEYNKYL